jgi:ABC-type sugar transport system ATPase subunit
MTMGDRVAVMKDGVLQQCDSPLALYDKPRNLFVAGFIGSPSMNLMEGTLVDGGAKLGDYTVPVPRETLAKASGDKSVMLGIRPENFQLGSGEEGIPVDVAVTEELGADCRVQPGAHGVFFGAAHALDERTHFAVLFHEVHEHPSQTIEAGFDVFGGSHQSGRNLFDCALHGSDLLLPVTSAIAMPARTAALSRA